MSFYQKTLYFSRDMWYDSKKILPFNMWQLGGDKVRILICDDDARIREKIRECIKIYLQGIEVKRAEIVLFADGNELLKDKGQKDIVFLDIVMPVKDGVEAAREIMQQHPSATIIIASSIGTKEQLKNAIEAGAKDFIQKPFSASSIKRIIEARFEC